ncbi:hypothetical protein [Streptomyces yanii]|uniref:hypothetical protein n=1 Tax=Streptomyces yanii TaxID=78510 RepID=UPI0031ED9E9D
MAENSPDSQRGTPAAGTGPGTGVDAGAGSAAGFSSVSTRNRASLSTVSCSGGQGTATVPPGSART